MDDERVPGAGGAGARNPDGVNADTGIVDAGSSIATPSLARLLAIMRRLRAPDGGCPWDREQTFASIAPHTVEEAYEVADAIESGDVRQLCEELGDLLFQVVFLAELGRESGEFDFEAVAATIVDKLVRRHPHVFGGDRPVSSFDAAAQSRAWEAIKATERAARTDSSVLADIPRALPAQRRARKLGQRAAAVHFDFPDARGARAKLIEELGELDEVIAAGTPAAEPDPRAHEEYGDLLFAAVNWGRHLGLDAEESLRAANAKFERRFRTMEDRARERGLDLGRLHPAEWDALWVEVK